MRNKARVPNGRRQKQFIILCCPECGYTAAKNGEARRTLRGAVRVWNKRIKEERGFSHA